MCIALAKPRSARGASHQPSFMGIFHLTVSQIELFIQTISKKSAKQILEINKEGKGGGWGGGPNKKWSKINKQGGGLLFGTGEYFH